MKCDRRRRTVLSSCAIAALVTVGLAYAARDRLWEMWWLRELEGPTLERQVAGAAGLGRLRSLRAVGPLTEIVQRSVDQAATAPALTEAAIVALGAIGARAATAVPTLTEIFAHDRDESLRPLAPTMQGGDLERCVVDALIGIGADGVPAVIEAIWSRNGFRESPFRRVLTGMGLPGFQGLVDAMCEPDDTLRRRIGMILRKIPPAISVPVLVEVFRDGDSDYRAQVAYLLGRIGKPAERAAKLLAYAAADREEALLVRSEAVRAIGDIRPKPFPERALAIALDDPSAELRAAAIETVARIGSLAAPLVAPLARGLAHPSDPIRGAASRALGRLGAQALRPVFDVLRDAEGATLRWSRHAVWEIATRDRAALPALVAALGDRSEPVRAASAWALELVGDEARRALVHGLSSENPRVAATAKEIVARLDAEL